jgi:arylsulfatase A
MDQKLKLLAGSVSTGVILLSCGSPKTAVNKEQPVKPNIVFILADDLGYGDVGFMGQKRFATPNLDRLAAQGLVFTDHYSGCTVSAPSRCSLMTGLHTGHTIIRGNKEHQPEGQEPIPSSVVTIAELLHAAGYATGAFGKWGLGSPGSEGDPVNQGFDEFFGYNCQKLAHNYYPYYLWHNREKVILKENEGQQKGIYAPGLIHSQALNFLENNKSKPFFLYYATTIPHAELTAPERYMEKFRGKFLPEKTFKGTDEGPTYRQGPYGSQLESHAAFAAMVTLLDEQVGEIMNKLEESGIAKNTIVIFSSDNGPHLEGGADPDFFDSNGPLKGYKRDLYEGGIRVPFVACWPGKITPGKTDHISAFWDLLPTCCDLASIPQPADLDGISYLPTLLGQTEKQKQHEYLYWEFHEKGNSQAIRSGKWKGVKREMNLPLELYDLSADINETQNIAGTNLDIVGKLEKLLAGARTESEIWPVR